MLRQMSRELSLFWMLQWDAANQLVVFPGTILRQPTVFCAISLHLRLPK